MNECVTQLQIKNIARRNKDFSVIYIFEEETKNMFSVLGQVEIWAWPY